MTQKRKDLPQPSASNFQQRLREALQTYMGRQGDPLDRGITLRDLLDTGLAKLRDGATLGPGSSTPPLAPIPVVIPVYEADLTPPPQPDGFAVFAAIRHVFIEHNPPTYTQGHGHLRTRVYGAIVTPALPMPVFSDAVEITQFAGTIHAHPSTSSTTWRLWIKWESKDGVLSATPAGGTNGLLVTTGEYVPQLLEALAGQITSSELASSLATPIASINQPTTGIVARLNAQSSLIGSLQTEVAALSGTPDYAAGTTYAADDIVQYSGGLYRAIATTTGNLPTNTTYWQKIGDYASLGDAVAAHAVRLDDHQTRIVATEAGLVAEASARTVLAATVAASTAAISAEASTRASADSALSSTISTVSAVANSKVKTYNQTTAPTTGMTAGDLWFDSDANNRVYRYSGSAWVETTDPRILSTAAAVTAETTARVAGDAALASQITTLSGTVAGNTAAISTEATARANADSALSSQVTALTSTVSGNNTAQTAAITAEASARAGADSALSTQLTSLTATVSGNNTAQAAAIQSEATARANADGALSTQVTALTATVTSNNTAQSAAVSAEATARANADGSLFAQYTVKTDVAGLVSGYGLASTATNAAPTSSFGVRASSFFVAPPAIVQAAAPTANLYKGMVWQDTGVTPNVTRYWNGSAWTTAPQVFPFVIQAAPTTINGVEVPPGVYIENAYMAQLVATRGQIGILAVDDARIASVAVDKLVAGSIAVGEYIQATGYVAGSAGWRINGDGTAEFSGVVVRGTVYANAGLIGGNVINSSGIESPLYVAGTSGWRLGSDGFIDASSGTFRGTVTAGGVELGADVGPGSGNFGLSLSAENANDVFMRRSSDGVRFFRVNSGGSNSITFDSASGALNITGNITARSFATIGGRFTADSSGLVVADRVSIRRRDVIQSGSLNPAEVIAGSYTYSFSDGKSSSSGTASYGAGTVFQGVIQQVVLTDIYDFDTQSPSANQPYYVAANFDGSAFRSFSGGSSSYELHLMGTPSSIRTYSNAGAFSNNGRICIVFRYAIRLVSGSFNSFQLPTASWTLFKI